VARIVLKDVSKIYTVGSQSISAVLQASFTIETGDFVSIVGHSGSGKTTLLSMLGGIIMPTSGSIHVDTLDITSLSNDRLSEYRNGKIGFMFQFASLLPMLTVQENLMLPAVFASPRSDGSCAADRAADLISMVGLGDKINAYPSQLSGGQQRRAAIARAFINQPSVILADEPTGDLDESTETDMMKFFMTMNQSGTTFVMVTHNTDLAAQANRQFTMHEGILSEQ
jgi:ABC-type lipoprotein export system ATPase subunit